ncbi:ShlB/FhaC/HecB family hemolysin secretion/activation protein [Acerihabitans sp. TG2]|uniref:ShlB/FhaC/HecB family hemolysin secretion/activation protein n=1 Tax=Acerihabitans sp. TG2 TaxID=3096008 RepID=UPI002B2223CD|nr:ShlB/FhaC/HecB family hemolysin secretion/activation protein [Acerihabitans sp. TG2]MEA9390519.1 ShlB/FhaC/HecB family hemolysin secretion/activation protein [Acerihabitans sp. TG2]
MPRRLFYLLSRTLLWLWLSTFGSVFANPQMMHQQQRQTERERQLTPDVPDIRLLPPVHSSSHIIFPLESPCFTINRVMLSGAEAFPSWVHLQRLADQTNGRCMGTNSINVLMSALQNRLTGHGWITARVMVAPQDLRQGTLELVVIPGRVDQVRLEQASGHRSTLHNALPVSTGDLLDLRAVEQGLENMQRLPTVTATVELLPGEQPGFSDILIKRSQRRPWRVRTWLDDSGNTTTGRYRGGVMLAFDGPLSFNDLFYLTAERDLHFAGEKNLHSFSGHYSIPYGYWLFGITADTYDYRQQAAGLNGPIVYEGQSGTLAMRASRLVHRNATQKTSVKYEVRLRRLRNYINGNHSVSQKRNTSSWRLGVDHRFYLGAATLDTNVTYQQGTTWFGARPAPEERTGQGTALSEIIHYSAQLNAPFSLGDQRWRYRTHYQRQISRTPLTAPDRFSLGTWGTTRGFDGEHQLIADDGWYLRNELAWRTPVPGQEWYVGFDYGEVGGRNMGKLQGTRLAGGVTGLRGALAATGIGYDLFAGRPFSKPNGFETDPLRLGFNLTWEY